MLMPMEGLTARPLFFADAGAIMLAAMAAAAVSFNILARNKCNYDKLIWDDAGAHKITYMLFCDNENMVCTMASDNAKTSVVHHRLWSLPGLLCSNSEACFEPGWQVSHTWIRKGFQVPWSIGRQRSCLRSRFLLTPSCLTAARSTTRCLPAGL